MHPMIVQGQEQSETTAGGSTLEHTQMMRGHINDVLGPEKLQQLYKRTQEMLGGESYDVQELSTIIGTGKFYIIEMMKQLVIDENKVQSGVLGPAV